MKLKMKIFTSNNILFDIFVFNLYECRYHSYENKLILEKVVLEFNKIAALSKF